MLENVHANIQSIKDCLKEYSTWGETHIMDICTGKEHVIPWGITEYFFFFIFILLVVFLLTIIVCVVNS